MDVFIAILALLFFLPLMVVVAILIVIDSPGPIFFIQNRVGARRYIHNHTEKWGFITFPCIKFRTMMHNSDPSLHQAYIKAYMNNDEEGMTALQGKDTMVRKLTNDPRITRLGKFLRKTSIDELPQLINVIQGEMSLVGPRPAIPYEVEMYKPWHYHRLETMPGITGLWQVTARSSADFDDMVRIDLDYIQRQSLWFDLKILIKTPYEVILCRGAG